MSAPIQGSHYWVFDERQIEAALDEWQRDGSEEARGDRFAVWSFLNSGPCVQRGMRRGGREGESE